MKKNEIIKAGDLRGSKWESYLELWRRVYNTNGIRPTIPARVSDSDSSAIKIITRTRAADQTKVVGMLTNLKQLEIWQRVYDPEFLSPAILANVDGSMKTPKIIIEK